MKVFYWSCIISDVLESAAVLFFVGVLVGCDMIRAAMLVTRCELVVCYNQLCVRLG